MINNFVSNYNVSIWTVYLTTSTRAPNYVQIYDPVDETNNSFFPKNIQGCYHVMLV